MKTETSLDIFITNLTLATNKGEIRWATRTRTNYQTTDKVVCFLDRVIIILEDFAKDKCCYLYVGEKYPSAPEMKREFLKRWWADEEYANPNIKELRETILSNIRYNDMWEEANDQLLR